MLRLKTLTNTIQINEKLNTLNPTDLSLEILYLMGGKPIQNIVRMGLQNALKRAMALMRHHQWVSQFLYVDLKTLFILLMTDSNDNLDGKISNVLFKLKPILNLLETMFARNLRPMPVMFENMLKTIREKYPDRPFYATYERRMASGSIVVWQTRKTAPIQSVRDDDVKIIYPAYKDVNLEVKLDEARRFVNKVKFTIKLVEESSLSEEDKSMFSSLLKSILKMMSQNAAWVMNCSLKIEEQVSSLKTMLNMKRVNKKDLAKINEQLTKAVRKFNEKYICWRKAEQNFWYRVEPFLGLLATQVSQSLILQKKHLMYMNKCK